MALLYHRDFNYITNYKFFNALDIIKLMKMLSDGKKHVKIHFYD